MKNIVITLKENVIAAFEYHDSILTDIRVINREETLGVNTIILGKIQKIDYGINGIFVEITGELKGYLPFNNLLNYKKDKEVIKKYRAGNEILVQIDAAPSKSKLARLTNILSLTGEYSVLQEAARALRYSAKITQEDKKLLKEKIREATGKQPGQKKEESFGFIIRTNAVSLENALPLLQEMDALEKQYVHIRQYAENRTLYSILYKQASPLTQYIRNINMTEEVKITTDNAEIFAEIKEFQEKSSLSFELNFYQDKRVSLNCLYALESRMKEAVDKKVWLKSGGFLYIENTEAMCVIDVNSAKASGTGKKNLYFKINEEAADEIARQIIIRNLSGIIMIDFINMETPQENQQIMSRLSENLKNDKCKGRVIDITPLGIVEVTRKKVDMPLSEALTALKK